ADRTIERAAHDQLTAAVGADVVATPRSGATPQAVDVIRDQPGVARATTLGAVPARVRTDDELPGALGWEAAQLLVVDPAAWGSLVDPGLRAGSAAALARPGTIALSRDAALEAGAHLGQRLTLRAGGADRVVRVVATYDRGLGLGPYVVGPATAAATGVAVPVRDVLVRADAGTAPARLRDALAATLGPRWQVVEASTWTAAASSPDAAGQRLSTVLLLLLLSFVALGAANALVLSVRNRREELALLHRTGATRRQLVRMLATEALVCAGLAWLVGTLTVLPAVVAMQLGLLGGLAAPALPVLTWAGLSLAALLLSVGTSVAAVTAVTRVPAPPARRVTPLPATA
ncbi:FtsX-like permease family protein, partial [Nocardioides zeicaulis]